MKGCIAALLALLIGSTVSAEEVSLSSRLFMPNQTALALADGGVTAPGHQSAAPMESGAKAGELQPGRALLLSAILPGAGEYYSGHKIRAALFFAVEIAAWTGVIYYYNQGMNKDKEFKKYANAHFKEQVYRDLEYGLAQNPQYGDSAGWHGTYDEWQSASWDLKIHYLPDVGFTHELPDSEERGSNASQDQQYYEMIGKYVHQFGFGWDDVFLGSPGHVTGYLGDDASTPQYDDQGFAAKKSLHYMDMRYDSNKLLDRSALAIQIALLNHVASALDASFTVRAMKRKADAKVGFRGINYNGSLMAVGGLNVQW